MGVRSDFRTVEQAIRHGWKIKAEDRPKLAQAALEHGTGSDGRKAIAATDCVTHMVADNLIAQAQAEGKDTTGLRPKRVYRRRRRMKRPPRI